MALGDAFKNVRDLSDPTPKTIETLVSALLELQERFSTLDTSVASLTKTPTFQQDVEANGNLVLKLTQGDACFAAEWVIDAPVRRGQIAVVCTTSPNRACLSSSANQTTGIGIFLATGKAKGDTVQVGILGLCREISTDAAAVNIGDHLATSATAGRAVPLSSRRGRTQRAASLRQPVRRSFDA